MTPIPQPTLQGYTQMAHREAVANAPAPSTRIEEFVTHEEIIRHMHFTAETLKAEISQHVDDEIERFKTKIKEKP